MSVNMFTTLSKKLGITDVKVVNKAGEILRLIDIKNLAIPLNGTSKLVAALDLAATSLKFHLDRNQAINLAGVGKKNYLTTLQLLDDILNLSPNLSIKDICLQLGCMNVTSEASNIIKRYEEIYDKHNTVDCRKPMFLVAAVFVACKKTKTRIDQTKLVELAKVKRSMLKRITLAMEMLSLEPVEEESKQQKTLLEMVEDKYNAEVETPNKRLRSHDQESQDENYASWRQKILANAAAAIALRD
uniref:Origin recognition complex subunit 6 n=1 Tax=Strigamia maritima TaxID=126957 RepID=T1ISA5_STRMM